MQRHPHPAKAPPIVRPARGLGAALIVAAVLATPVGACSRILCNSAGCGVFVSRSLDWHELVVPQLRVHPRGTEADGGPDPNAARWTAKYGSLLLVGTNYDDAGLDGVNERGLTVHLLYLGEAEYEPRDGRPGVSYARWVQYLLGNYATVAEALEGSRGVQVYPVEIHGSVFPVHLALEDPSGDSAIVEFLDGKAVVHHGRQYKVLCNEPSYEVHLANLKHYLGFGGSKELPGGVESSDRFVRASYFLNNLPEPADHAQGVASVIQLIRNVSVPFGAPYKTGTGAGVYPTWWVTAADLTDRVYYFNATTSPNLIWIDLSELDLSPGAPALKLDPMDPALVGDVSKSFAGPRAE